MAEADPTLAWPGEGLMENLPLRASANAEGKTFKSCLAVKQTQDFKSSHKSRGRPRKKSADSTSASDIKKHESSRSRGQSKKTNVMISSLSLSDGKKLDFSPLKSSNHVETELKSKGGNGDSVGLSTSDACMKNSEFKEHCVLNTQNTELAFVILNDSNASTENKVLETSTSSAKKSLKRKRSLFLETLDVESKSAHTRQFQQEMESLFKYFHETFEKIVPSEKEEIADNASTNAVIACLLEDSRLPFSKLVQQIHEKMKNKLDQNGVEISLAFVRSSVLVIGQRPSYGIPTSEADVLEDESESCLWCWEVRDLKLLPKSQRDFASIRRRCRKKIHERITALQAMLSALASLSGLKNFDLAKAEELVMKSDDEITIRTMVSDFLQKSVAQIMARQAKQKEKEAIKEKERNEKISEKEQKRLGRELRKEKIQQEKEMKRQQEEAEKEQKRREKEEAEVKKKLALQKQATIMDRFLQSKKEAPKTENDKETSRNFPKENAHDCSGVIMLMDQTLQQEQGTKIEDLLRSHLAAWHDANCKSSTISLIWGKRRKPKVAMISELRLQQAPAEAVNLEKVQSLISKKRPALGMEDQESKSKNVVNDWEEQALCETLPDCNVISDINRENLLHNKKRKLLQFDKSHRPAYYGTFSKKSNVVVPRHPFRKEPSLDYDIDSDEEWEEEDPGESLSDCDDDDEEEKIEAEKEKLKHEDDDESEDGFLVPDGYLSENEGVCLDDESEMDEDPLENSVPQNCGQNHQLDTESEWHAFEQQQKVLENVTDRALRTSRAFIVNNLHKYRNSWKSEPGSPELNSRQRVEQTCLQALRFRICSSDIIIELPCPLEASAQDDQGLSKPQKKSNPLSDADLPALVSIIQCSSQGINKIVDSLLTKFPNVPKTQFKSKIREIADFAENRWQVKNEVLEKLNMLPHPVQILEVTETPTRQQKGVAEKSPIQAKGIITYFPKRCLPPESAGVDNIQTLPGNGSHQKQKDNPSQTVEKCTENLMHC